MVLKLYKSDASPPVRAVLMTIEAANIPNVEMIDVNVLEGDHLKEEYLKEPLFYKGEKSFKQESLDKIKSGYEFSEKFLTKRWIAGDEFTLADIFFLASIRSSIEVQPIDSEE
ncbi:Glutathione S-transferase 1 [Papilio machaon]|uniref:Glutathione S-transferase 1 n=1 Tax=Papilio machaon TaxID=76193 RepID=A0A194R5D8_PAPMA|nr:Glutathione S-transferase 1 [Papilio machaon]